jgi:hypothetical protein
MRQAMSTSTRPQSWIQVWRYARGTGYPRTTQGWLTAWADLIRASGLKIWLGMSYPRAAEEVLEEGRDLEAVR